MCIRGVTKKKMDCCYKNFITTYRVSINYCYNFQSLSKFYFLRYFHLICFIVKENASSFFLTDTCGNN